MIRHLLTAVIATFASTAYAAHPGGGGGHAGGGHPAGGGTYHGGGHPSGGAVRVGVGNGGVSVGYSSGYRGGVNFGVGFGGYGGGYGGYSGGYGGYSGGSYYSTPNYYVAPRVVAVPSYPQSVPYYVSPTVTPVPNAVVPKQRSTDWMPPPVAAPAGPFKYDGDPVNPIPLPVQDPPAEAKPDAKNIKVSLKAPATLKYLGYGEK